MALITYNQVIRKIVLGFGDLFSNITLIRYTQNLTEVERFPVPLVYASKENYVLRLEGDPTLDKKVQMTLPIMSYEMKGCQYAPNRKLNTNVQNFSQAASGMLSQYNPVPYNFDFELVIYVRNIEDGAQIVEHILPFFTPDYTINVNLVPVMGTAGIRQLPITLNNTHYDVRYEGNRESDPRMVVWTLNFTVQGFIFPSVNQLGANNGVITHTITSFYSMDTAQNQYTFNMNTGGNGNYQMGEIVYQGPSPTLPLATATVVSWSNTLNQLIVTNIDGNFVSNQPIIGIQTFASWNFGSYTVAPEKYAEIDVTPKPANANVSNTTGFITTITEEPNK